MGCHPGQPRRRGRHWLKLARTLSVGVDGRGVRESGLMMLTTDNLTGHDNTGDDTQGI